MLPRSLYELLPYLYMAAGVGSALLIDSGIIMIASALLVSAGILTLFLRYQYRRQTQEVTPATERRTGQDRRQAAAAMFPLVDFAGNTVEYDRRSGDRRHQLHPEMA